MAKESGSGSFQPKPLAAQGATGVSIIENISDSKFALDHKYVLHDGSKMEEKTEFARGKTKAENESRGTYEGRKMDEIIAYCGLVCQGCPIYWAARQSNDEKRRKMRAEIALQIKKQGGGEYEPQDITDCDGCKTENGRLFPSCKKCEIRKCARQNGIENCAHCNEYACERLDRFFTDYPEAKSRLDVIRSTL